MSDSEITQAIEQYWQARKHLLELGKRDPNRIGGNDNIIGRIGEFIALRFLESLEQNPQKVENSSNQGYDLVEGDVLTQVKVITAENANGRGMRLKQPWNQFVLIELDHEYQPKRIGVLTKAELQQACSENKTWSESPVTKISMLNDNGLIGRYGTVYPKSRIPVWTQ